MPLRVTADSNVIISGFHAAGNPRAVLELARRGEIELYLSPFIVREVSNVLAGAKFRWAQERIRRAFVGVPFTLIDSGPPRLRAVAGDPDNPDNRILECARAARATYLVTGDRDLLDLGSYRRIRILTPRAFLDLIKR